MRLSIVNVVNIVSIAGALALAPGCKQQGDAQKSGTRNAKADHDLVRSFALYVFTKFPTGAQPEEAITPDTPLCYYTAELDEIVDSAASELQTSVAVSQNQVFAFFKEDDEAVNYRKLPGFLEGVIQVAYSVDLLVGGKKEKEDRISVKFANKLHEGQAKKDGVNNRSMDTLQAVSDPTVTLTLPPGFTRRIGENARLASEKATAALGETERAKLRCEEKLPGNQVKEIIARGLQTKIKPEARQ